MAKKRTREEKIISKLRKLESLQSLPDTVTPNSHSSPLSKPLRSAISFKPVTSLRGEVVQYSYIRRDLVKICILATIAIIFQLTLSLILNGYKFKW